MKFEIRDSRFAVALFSLLIASTALAQQHPITFDDMAAIRRIGAPQVSPDGHWVAYDASTVDLPANYRHSAIYLVPSNGGDSRRITDGVKQDEGPAWSPDGKTIAYVSDRDGGAKQVWLYDVATSASRKLTNLQGDAGGVVDHVPVRDGVGQGADGGPVTYDAALQLHGEHGGVRRGEQLGEVDGHETGT